MQLTIQVFNVFYNQIIWKRLFYGLCYFNAKFYTISFVNRIYFKTILYFQKSYKKVIRKLH